MGAFKLNGVSIKNPKTFKVDMYTLTKSTRVANGDMVMDFVANKRKFDFSYDAISSRELNVIIDQVWTNLAITRQCFVELEYPDDYGEIKTVTVYAGSVPKQLHRGDGRVWVWKNVSFSLIER